VKDYTSRASWTGWDAAVPRADEDRRAYEYRERLTMPKFMLNASGDQFFLPIRRSSTSTSSRARSTCATCRTRLTHSTRATRSRRCTRSRPPWSPAPSGGRRSSGPMSRTGRSRSSASSCRAHVQLWQAVNPKARNFRLDAIGPLRTRRSTERPNTWVGKVQPPPTGWTAFFVELTFAGTGKYR
jgi:hypothetical protein